MVTGLNTVFSCTTNSFMYYFNLTSNFYIFHSINSKQLMNPACNQNVAVCHVSAPFKQPLNNQRHVSIFSHDSHHLN